MFVNILSILLLVASVLLLSNPDAWLPHVRPVARPPLPSPPPFRHRYDITDDIWDAYDTDVPIVTVIPIDETDVPIGETDVPIGETDAPIETDMPIETGVAPIETDTPVGTDISIHI